MNELSTGYELILNACEGALQIAVTENEQPLCFEEWRLPKRGSEILADAIAEICRRLAIKPDIFKRIGCFSGPGSFTGIRLVLTTAAALRRTSNAQLASLDYLQALATSAIMYRGLLYPEKVFVVTHARRNLVHFQEFISYGPQIPAVANGEVELMPPETALAKFGQQKCLVCGSGLKRNPRPYAIAITGKGPEQAPNAILMPDLVNPALSALCLLARHGDYFPTDLEPRYIRPCDAVENLSASDNLKVQQLQKDIPS